MVEPSSAPRRSSSVPILLSLVVGLVIGSSCVTCARIPIADRDRVVDGSAHRVGVVELLGPIAEVDTVVRHIRSLARRDDLKAMVVRIDSPGGAVAPSQEVYEAMRYASERMPVVASMGTVAASGGFWASLGADWVVAAPGTITGSIGVITQIPDLRGIAEKVDFRLRTFKSGPVKDLGNPLRELTDADVAVFEALIDDVFDQFVTLTARRRKLSRADVLKVADGRIMSGRDAREAGLVDELGGLYTAARRAVVLAEEREGVATTETSTTTLDDPTLVYPKDDTSALLELLNASVRDLAVDAVSEGVSEGLSRAGGQVPQIR